MMWKNKLRRAFTSSLAGSCTRWAFNDGSLPYSATSSAGRADGKNTLNDGLNVKPLPVWQMKLEVTA